MCRRRRRAPAAARGPTPPRRRRCPGVGSPCGEAARTCGRGPAQSRTQSATLIRPARTPCHTRVMRVSMPGSPPGISVKSAKPPSRPAVPRRRSARQNGQWSVATVWTHPGPAPPRAPHGAVVAAVAYRRSSRPRALQHGGVEVQVLRAGLALQRDAPFLGGPHLGQPRCRRQVDDVHARAPAVSASRPTRCTASASRTAARVAACSTTPVRPSASARRRSASMAPPFS